MYTAVNLGSGVYQVDVYDQEPGRTSCYLILADKVALIETGPSPGAGHIMSALKSLAVRPQDVEFIIVTHIHLDHAGGAGVVARELPAARVFVHPRGARHLTDPSKLIAGARNIYGNKFDSLFGEILPIPSERVFTPEDGEVIDLGGRELSFYHTPGHARHHFVVHDPQSRGVFGGDALGVRFKALSELVGFDFTLPSTPPTEFDPASAVQTMDRMSGLDLENIYFTHFGKAGGAPAILERNRELVSVYESVGLEIIAGGGGAKDIEEALWELAMNELRPYGFSDRLHPAVQFLSLDLKLNAEGIAHFLEKKK